MLVCRNGLHGCVRVVETLGNDLKFTWIGVRKSWIEAVKVLVNSLNPPERIDFSGITRGSTRGIIFDINITIFISSSVAETETEKRGLEF